MIQTCTHNATEIMLIGGQKKKKKGEFKVESDKPELKFYFQKPNVPFEKKKCVV